LNTLNPKKLIVEDQKIWDMSGLAVAVYNLVGDNREPLERQPALGFKRSGQSREIIPFPTGTRGVLYYRVDPTLPPISGSIRFRICDSLTDFEHGSDLLVNPWRPWELPLVNVAKATQSTHGPLCSKLLEDQLVDTKLVADIRRNLSQTHCDHEHKLYSLHQPLDFDLAKRFMVLNLITPQMLQKVRLWSPFSQGGCEENPYSGESVVPHAWMASYLTVTRTSHNPL